MSARDELAGILGGKLITRSSMTETADAILAAGYRKPPVIENDKLVIEDGMLLLEVGSCTCTPYGSSHERHCGCEYLDDLTKPLERAGYRKPRTITTAEELDALPVGSAVLSETLAYQKLDDDDWSWSAAGRFWHTGQIDLPATVLHEPEVKA